MIGDNGLECNGWVGWFAARTVHPTVLPTTSDSSIIRHGETFALSHQFDIARHWY